MNCYDKALSLLARIEHCRRGLHVKLAARGYEESDIEAALDRLSDEGHLDDRRYAELWIEFRMKRTREGRRLLLAGLVRRGVDRETADAAVRRASLSDAYAAALEQVYHQIRSQGVSSRREIVSRLLRRGYGPGEVAAYLENIDADFD